MTTDVEITYRDRTIQSTIEEMRPMTEPEFDGMPPPDVVVVFKYKHMDEGVLVDRDQVPRIDDQLTIPSKPGIVTKVTEYTHKGRRHFDVLVTEDIE